MAARPAGSDPAGEGEGRPALERRGRWGRGVRSFGAFVSKEGEGRLTSSGAAAGPRCRGFRRSTPGPGTRSAPVAAAGRTAQILRRNPDPRRPHPCAQPQASLKLTCNWNRRNS